MAKAHVTTPTGISIKVEGTPAEILAVVQDLERKEEKAQGSRTVARDVKATSGRLTLTSLLESLRDEAFFKQPRDLGSIRTELEAKGHFYPVTTLSGAVLGQVRKRSLRRLKKDGRWFYVRAG
jgi:hypothetical protein